MIICRCDNLYGEILDSIDDDSFENAEYLETCIRDDYIKHLTKYHSNVYQYYVIAGEFIYGLDNEEGPYLDHYDDPLYVIDNKYNPIPYMFRSDQSLLMSNVVMDVFPNGIGDVITSYLHCVLCNEYCIRECNPTTSSFRKKVYIKM